MSVLVLVDHNNKEFKSDIEKLIGAANDIDHNVTLLIFGFQCDSVFLQAQKLVGINKIIYIDDKAYQYQLAENSAKLIAQIAQDYSHVLAATSSEGKDILPRVAALLDVTMLSDVIDIIDDETFVRPIYAGNALAKIKVLDSIKLMTIRVNAFTALNNSKIQPINVIKENSIFEAKTNFISQFVCPSARPELISAKRIIAGGRGVGSQENFQLIENLADKLHAAIGASRAAVDAKFASNDLQVGQTGKIVAPDLYIAIGISGAIQHLAGIKDAKVIVAINHDPDAPIFQMADYGLVADLFEAVPELINSI